jgi:phosphatidylinositol alpha-mannosyltransferase
MRVLQVCPYDWDAPGGVQTHVRQLSEELRRRGHDVLVVAPGRQPGSESWVQIVGRPIGISFNGTIAPICLLPSAAWRIGRLLREFRPTIVHAHEPLAPSLGLYAGLLSTSPVVATFHAHCDVRIGRFLYGSVTWPLNWRIDAGIAVSRAATSCLGRGVRVPFQIVPNGVEGRFFEAGASRRPGATRRILFAHRLEPRKGFGVAVAAFAQLAEGFPDVELLVIGSGRERRLVDLLPSAVRRRVRLLDTVSRSALAAEFASADVFIAPAVHGESFGVVLLEAMAAGLPVVASDLRGYREVLRDGHEALLVPPGDPGALAAAVDRVLQSADLARRLGSAGRARAMSFSWTRIAEMVEQVYNEVTAAPSSARSRVAI